MCDVRDSIAENVEEPFACHAPYNPPMVNSDERLQSFTKNWPVKRHVTPREMADAGFYYLDAKWFPLCEYVLKKQCVDYVKDITLKYPK